MTTLNKIENLAIRQALGNACLSKVTLAINAGGAATIKTTGTTIYGVNGVACSKAVLAAQSFAVTHSLAGAPVAQGPAAYIQPISTTVYYVVALNAAGTVAIVQGGYNGQQIRLPAGASYESKGEMPTVPAGYTPIGYVKVTTNGATTFTPGTTVLDVAGVTAVYVDCIVLPAETNP